MDKVTICVPLGNGSVWENNELRYMLRSLDANLKYTYDLILFTSRKVEWLNCKQKIIPRTYPKELLDFFKKKHYENYYDVYHKIKAMANDDDVSDNFIYMYDDLILLKPIIFKDLKKLYAAATFDDISLRLKNPKNNKWLNTIRQAADICGANNYSSYIYETHLPRYYNKEKLNIMFNKHPIVKKYIPYAISTLYYNMYYDKPDAIYNEENNVKAGFYGGTNPPDQYLSETEEQVKKAVYDKVWGNYNNQGLTGALKLWIEKQYPNKSKWEI